MMVRTVALWRRVERTTYTTASAVEGKFNDARQQEHGHDPGLPWIPVRRKNLQCQHDGRRDEQEVDRRVPPSVVTRWNHLDVVSGTEHLGGHAGHDSHFGALLHFIAAAAALIAWRMRPYVPHRQTFSMASMS